MGYTLSEDIIIDGIRSGSEVMFKLVYENYYSSLVILAGRYLYNYAECEDCVQTVFMRIWIKRESLQITQSISSYLFTAVKNQCLNIIDKNKYSINSDFNIQMINEYDELTPERLTTINQLKEKIQFLINQLPDRQHKAFILSRFKDKTYKEIAEILGVSIKSIEADISKALSFLKSNIDLY